MRGGGTLALSERLELRSHFQTIFSVAHRSAVGHEALLRALGPEGPLGAAQVLQALTRDLDPDEVEKRCVRQHLIEFAQQQRDGWLFLNVTPSSLPDRESVVRLFGQWLHESKLEGRRVVVEIVETEARSEGALASAIQGFRDLGCWVAIDDFGAGESNFERIWRMKPNIVKLDRAMLEEACRQQHVRQLVPGIVSLLHEAGCLVVLEGIETDEQALIAMESDVDFVQGFLFSRPSERVPDSEAVKSVFDRLSESLRSSMMQRGRREEEFAQAYAAPIETCAQVLAVSGDFVGASRELIRYPGVLCVYLLNEDGRQVGHNLESEDSGSDDAMGFGPFLHSEGADWFRRPYFQRAIARPGTVQLSRRYLSIRDARPCVTFSIAISVLGQERVLCVDLDHDRVTSGGTPTVVTPPTFEIV